MCPKQREPEEACHLVNLNECTTQSLPFTLEVSSQEQHKQLTLEKGETEDQFVYIFMHFFKSKEHNIENILSYSSPLPT